MRTILFIACLLMTALLCADGVQPSGTGTETDPYLISTLDNLLWLSTTPNVWDDNAYFLQTADIDASDTENWNNGAGFSSIGEDPIFTGHYNGGGHYIVDLHTQDCMFHEIDAAEIINLNILNYFMGNFILDCVNSVVSNCTFHSVDIEQDNNTFIRVSNNSMITNCVTLGSIRIRGIIDEEGSINGWGGGLIGQSYNDVVTNCSSSCTIYGNVCNVGGLVGKCYGSTITNCSFTGEIINENRCNISGLVSYCYYSSISNCVVSGFLNGGLGLIYLFRDSEISSCTFTGEINYDSSSYRLGVSLLFAANSSGTIENCFYNYEEVLVNEEHCVLSDALPSDLYNDWIDNNMEISTLNISDYLSYNDGAYQIDSFSDLQKLILFGANANLQFSLNTNIDLSSHCGFSIPILNSDFIGNGNSISNLSQPHFHWGGLFSFIGDCTLSNLSIIGADIQCYQGGIVCYSLDNGGVISDVSVSNGTVLNGFNIGGICGVCKNGEITGVNLSNINLTGTRNVGGICGILEDSTISTSHVNGIVHRRLYYDQYDEMWYGGEYLGGLVGTASKSNISRSSFCGKIIGRLYCGGIIGYSSDTVLIDSYSSVTIEGVCNMGGLVGGCGGIEIENCYAIGEFINTIINNTQCVVFQSGGIVGVNAYNSSIGNCFACIAFPENAQPYRIGGIVGVDVTSMEMNCIWNQDLNSVSDGIGYSDNGSGINLVGATTQEMQNITTYINLGWDFLGEIENGTEDIWTINPDLNNGYPYLVALEQSVGNEEDTNATPELQTKLYNNYPNPFNPETTISFSVKKNDVASLKIFNIRGQVVKSFPMFASGEHKVIWKGVDKKNKSVASGVYFYRLESKTGSQTKKMILIK